MEEKILDILEEVCEDDIVKQNADVDLFESGLLDSLGFAEMLAAIEEECGVVIAPSEVDRKDLDTPAKIIQIVKERS